MNNTTTLKNAFTTTVLNVYSTTSPHRHLYHHNSDGSMSVAVPLEIQLDTRCNLTMRKSDDHIKHSLVFVWYKSLFATTLLSSCWEKTEYELNQLLQKEITVEGQERPTQTLILSFSIVILVCDRSGSRLYIFTVGYGTLSWSSPKWRPRLVPN